MRDPPPRLGRGLASLLGDTAGRGTPSAEAQVGPVSVSQLDSNPYQPRRPIEPATLVELTASIAQQGVLQPLLVRPCPGRPGRFQIVSGERRWRAAQLAGLPTVPCFVRDLDDTAITIAALVENLQRRDLDAIEEASGYRKLITEFGLTQEDLSTAVGKSRSHVANSLRLLHLPTSVQAQVQSGLLSAGHARAALAAADPAAAAAAMIAQGLNVRQAEALTGTATAKLAKPAPHRPPPSPHDPDLQAVAADLTETLGMAVSIAFDGRGGSLTVRYRTLDQLDHIIARLGR